MQFPTMRVNHHTRIYNIARPQLCISKLSTDTTTMVTRIEVSAKQRMTVDKEGMRPHVSRSVGCQVIFVFHWFPYNLPATPFPVVTHGLEIKCPQIDATTREFEEVTVVVF